MFYEVESENLPLYLDLGLTLLKLGEEARVPLATFSLGRSGNKGLRQYKDKFGPEWKPRYLASRGGPALPNIFPDVASLISGGLKGGFSK